MKGQSPSLSWQAETEIDKITALRKSQQESNTYVPITKGHEKGNTFESTEPANWKSYKLLAFP